MDILTTVPAMLNELYSHLKQLPDLESVSVEQFSPSNAKEKYQYLQTSKSKGFPFPTALLTYAHGNNVGNFNFIWRVQSTSERSFSDCQSVIENVKKKSSHLSHKGDEEGVVFSVWKVDFFCEACCNEAHL